MTCVRVLLSPKQRDMTTATAQPNMSRDTGVGYGLASGVSDKVASVMLNSFHQLQGRADFPPLCVHR